MRGIMEMKFTKKTILLFGLFCLLLQTNIQAATTPAAGLVGDGIDLILNGYGAYKDKQDDENAKLVSDGVGIVASSLSTRANILLLKADKLKNLLPSNTQRSIFDNISIAEQKAQTISKSATKLAYAGAALNVGLAANDWIKSDKALVDNLTLMKDLSVTATSFVPGVGTVVSFLDTEVDILVDKTNSALDDARAASFSQANYIQILQNAAYAKIDSEVASYIGAGNKVDRQKIIEIQQKVGTELLRELQQTEPRNSFFDGNVAKTNFERAQGLAIRFSNNEFTDTFLTGRVANIQQKYDNIQEANEVLAELNHEIENLKNDIEKINTLEDSISEFQDYIIGMQGSNQADTTPPIAESEDRQIQPQDPDEDSREKLADLKTEAEHIRQQNLQLATEYEELLKQGKGSSSQAEDVKRRLNETGETYRKLRAEIQVNEPGFAMHPYATSQTVLTNFQTAIADSNEELDEKRTKLEDKSREQLALQKEKGTIDSKIRSKNQQKRSYQNQINSLKNQENDLENQLRQVERQLAGGGSNSSSQDRDEIRKLERALEAFTYAANLNRKYRGDFSKITGKESAQLKIRASIALGAGKYYKVLFNGAKKYVGKLQAKLDSYQNQSGLSASDRKSFERQRDRIKRQLKEVKSSQHDLDYKLYSLNSTIRRLENDSKSLVVQLEDSREDLQDLVSDVTDLVKEQVASTQNPSNAPYIRYGGNISSLHSNNFGTIVSRGHGLDRSVASAIGMELNPESRSGIYGGDFNIATMTNSDSSGTYNYMSWGTWDRTTPAQTITRTSGEVGGLSGGFWARGLGTKDIPRQGSATYSGNLSGNYRSPALAIEYGTMSGTITLQADFANEKISGTLNILHNNAPWTNASFANENLHTDYGYFSTDNVPLTGSNVNHGYVAGRLFGEVGAIPVEAGGGWSVSQTDNSTAVGIFRAKKQ